MRSFFAVSNNTVSLLTVNFTCSICNAEINPHHHTYSVKILAWVEYRDGKYIGSPHKPSAPLGYAHKVCTESKNAFDDAPTLFD